MGPGLNLSQQLNLQQKLIIGPRMIQSMEILQMPLAALQERLDKELQENPVMELIEKKDDIQYAPEEAPPPSDRKDPYDVDGPMVHDRDNAMDFHRLDSLDRELSGGFEEDGPRLSRSARDEMGDKKLEAMNNLASRPTSLQDELMEQLTFMDLDATQTERVEYLMSHLDDRGYLSHSLEALAADHNPPLETDELEEALSYVHKLEPLGIGARDLKECLLLQLDMDVEHRDLIRQLIMHHLEDIQHNRMPLIEKRTGADFEEIQEAIQTLKRLNPRPGAGYGLGSTQYITPDIILDYDEETHDYTVRLTDEWMPEIHIPEKYYRMAEDKEADPATREYIRRKLDSANWLRNAILQRRQTLEKVTKAIVKHQKAFLDRGPEFIEPLKMQQIADEVSVHVTTISRAVDDKWIQTPRGVFPLKRFFGGGTKNELTGEEVAWETIRRRLIELVDAEDKSNPLSDEELVDKFKELGLDVKRRTVTKYRQMAKIPSSRERRDWMR